MLLREAAGLKMSPARKSSNRPRSQEGSLNHPRLVHYKLQCAVKVRPKLGVGCKSLDLPSLEY